MIEMDGGKWLLLRQLICMARKSHKKKERRFDHAYHDYGIIIV